MMHEKHVILQYEMAASSWWAGYVSIPWMQNLAARYIVWKVDRKYARMDRFRDSFARIMSAQDGAKKCTP